MRNLGAGVQKEAHSPQYIPSSILVPAQVHGPLYREVLLPSLSPAVPAVDISNLHLSEDSYVFFLQALLGALCRQMPGADVRMDCEYVLLWQCLQSQPSAC